MDFDCLDDGAAEGGEIGRFRVSLRDIQLQKTLTKDECFPINL